MRDPDALVFDLHGTLLEIASVGRAAATVTDDPARFVDLWRQKQLDVVVADLAELAAEVSGH